MNLLFANAATDSQTRLLIHNEDEQHNHVNVERKSLGDGSWTTLPFISSTSNMWLWRFELVRRRRIFILSAAERELASSGYHLGCD